MNSKRLPASNNQPVTVRAEGKEKRHAIYTSSTLSFLLPILPLTMRGAGSLSNDAGCTVCGQPSVSRCAACQHAAYCSKDCQKADWTASHKSECKKRALASATWIDVDISSPGYPKGHRRRAPNDFSAVATTTGISLNKKGERIRPAEDWPPPNIYDSKPFIVKIMGPEPEMGSRPLMVCDRCRSVEFYLSMEADSVSYKALLKVLRQTGYLGLRVFLFAKRTAPTTLSVCLDREPPAELVKW